MWLCTDDYELIDLDSVEAIRLDQEIGGVYRIVVHTKSGQSFPLDEKINYTRKDLAFDRLIHMKNNISAKYEVFE